PSLVRRVEGQQRAVLVDAVATGVVSPAALIHMDIVNAHGKVKITEARPVVETGAENEEPGVRGTHYVDELCGNHVRDPFVFWIARNLEMVHRGQVYQVLADVIEGKAPRLLIQRREALRQLGVQEALRDRVREFFVDRVEDLVFARTDIDGHPVAG